MPTVLYCTVLYGTLVQVPTLPTYGTGTHTYIRNVWYDRYVYVPTYLRSVSDPVDFDRYGT